jgi:hypothetical protein
MTHPRRKWLWIIALCVGFSAVASFSVRRAICDGYTDLTISFFVTEVSSRLPIPNAQVEVQSFGGLDDGGDVQRHFVLTTDHEGIASEVCPRNRMTVAIGLVMNRTSVSMPYWRFRVAAEGFMRSDWIDLYGLDYRAKVRRTEPGKSRLVIPTTLQRSSTQDKRV